MSIDDKSKFFYLGLKYLENDYEFEDSFSFLKKFYLEFSDLAIGDNIDSLNNYSKCTFNELETGDIIVYGFNDELLFGINFGSAFGRSLMYFDEIENKVKESDLMDVLKDYKFLYGLKLL